MGTLSRTRPHLHIPKKNELYYLRRTKRLVARVSIDVVFKDERRKAPNEIHVASMRRVRSRRYGGSGESQSHRRERNAGPRIHLGGHPIPGGSHGNRVEVFVGENPDRGDG